MSVTVVINRTLDLSGTAADGQAAIDLSEGWGRMAPRVVAAAPSRQNRTERGEGRISARIQNTLHVLKLLKTILHGWTMGLVKYSVLADKLAF